MYLLFHLECPFTEQNLWRKVKGINQINKSNEKHRSDILRLAADNLCTSSNVKNKHASL